jgi:hypothetical protein
MSASTKITLSDKELSLVTNAEWILTKQAIITKVYDLFAEMIPEIRRSFLEKNIALPAEVRTSIPKIYKGENYLQLPYVMLDYPRVFNAENIFALRTMFWWANFFSITLHVSGRYIQEIAGRLLKNKALLTQDFFVAINNNQWEHHFEAHNFMPYTQLDEKHQAQLFNQKDFIKISLKFDLSEWNNIPVLLSEGYEKMALLIT